jgi:dUTP pyrophosphatase
MLALLVQPHHRSFAMTKIKINVLPNAFGYDLFTVNRSSRIELLAALPSDKPIILKPRERTIISTGLAMQLPDDWEAQIITLETLASETGISVLNSPGTIDPDYRGEVMVILVNLGDRDVNLKRGSPIAVLKFAQFVRVQLMRSDTLSETQRGKNGLGSTDR